MGLSETACTGSWHWVESFADSPGGAWALFGISFAESSFFPIPPDVLLIALCIARPEEAHSGSRPSAAVASVLGGMLGLRHRFVGGRPVLHRMFSEQKIAAVKKLYDRYDAWATGIAGLTPYPLQDLHHRWRHLRDQLQDLRRGLDPRQERPLLRRRRLHLVDRRAGEALHREVPERPLDRLRRAPGR